MLTADQIAAQLRLIIPALGTIISAVGVSSTQVTHYEQMAIVAVGPISYIGAAIWSLYANSRKSIMMSAAKSVAPGVDPPQIQLPPQEQHLANQLPSNVTAGIVK